MQDSSAGLWHGTTILTVRKNGVVAVGGDGQVSMGQTIIKANAKKVRRLAKGDVIGGFAGAAKFMASKGMPLIEPLLVASILIELVGGLMLAVGWKARWAAWAIFLFIIPATLIFHAYWGVPADQVMNQQIHFVKNFALVGGLLAVIAHGAGRFALDRAAVEVAPARVREALA